MQEFVHNSPTCSVQSWARCRDAWSSQSACIRFCIRCCVLECSTKQGGNNTGRCNACIYQQDQTSTHLCVAHEEVMNRMAGVTSRAVVEGGRVCESPRSPPGPEGVHLTLSWALHLPRQGSAQPWLKPGPACTLLMVVRRLLVVRGD